MTIRKRGLTEFFTIRQYVEFTRKYLQTHPGSSFVGRNPTHVVMVCTCTDCGAGGPHMAAIRNDRDAIESHKEHEVILKQLRSENLGCTQ